MNAPRPSDALCGVQGVTLYDLTCLASKRLHDPFLALRLDIRVLLRNLSVINLPFLETSVSSAVSPLRPIAGRCGVVIVALAAAPVSIEQAS